jgi:hypothetical protein
MNDKQLKKLGELADSIDNILAGTELPLPAEFHLEQTKAKMLEWSIELKAMYCAISGENPWTN